jgi:hypothetical protein
MSVSVAVVSIREVKWESSASPQQWPFDSKSLCQLLLSAFLLDQPQMDEDR